jgi:hypothetical protein
MDRVDLAVNMRDWFKAERLIKARTRDLCQVIKRTALNVGLATFVHFLAEWARGQQAALSYSHARQYFQAFS